MYQQAYATDVSLGGYDSKTSNRGLVNQIYLNAQGSRSNNGLSRENVGSHRTTLPARNTTNQTYDYDAHFTETSRMKHSSYTNSNVFPQDSYASRFESRQFRPSSRQNFTSSELEQIYLPEAESTFSFKPRT